MRLTEAEAQSPVRPRYPEGNVRFFTATGELVDILTIGSSGQDWGGFKKDKKMRLAFKTMFISMVRNGFVLPGAAHDDVKRFDFHTGTIGNMKIVSADGTIV